LATPLIGDHSVTANKNQPNCCWDVAIFTAKTVNRSKKFFSWKIWLKNFQKTEILTFIETFLFKFL